MKRPLEHVVKLVLKMVAFALAFFANAAIAKATVLIPTDDTHVVINGGTPLGSQTDLGVKLARNTFTNASYTAQVAVIRFKIKPTDIAKDVELFLDVSKYNEAVACDFRLWGLADGAGSMQSMEDETAVWSTFAGVIINSSETGVITTANGVFDGNPSTSAKDPLATITLTQADLGKTVKFSSAALVNFINADNDGVVTFLVTRMLRSNNFETAFAAREHGVYSPPRLVIDAHTTLDAAADTYGRYADATVRGAEQTMLVKNNGAGHANTRRGVVRFELPAGTDVERAALSLDVTTYSQSAGTMPPSVSFFVFGVREGSPAENFDETTANEATFWNELDGSVDGVVNTQVEALGKFIVKSTDVGKTVSFTSDALVDFINTDTNGKVTLVIARAEYTPYLNFAFATKEHTTMQGPRLSMTQSMGDVATPTMKFAFKDVDGDGDNETLLVVEMPGGGGFVVYDPFVIAEALRISGYDFGTATAFWDTLSVSQQAGLLATVSSITPNVGTTVEASELHAARANLPEGRTYNVATFSGDFDSSGYNGMAFSASALSNSSSNALGYTTVEVGTVNGAAMFTDSGMAFGAEANLVVLTTGVGDPSGTTASVNLSAGMGLYTEMKYGQDGQYGASIPLVVIPVGVSVYVKGSDAVAAWDEVRISVVGYGLPLYHLSRDFVAWQIDWRNDIRMVSVNAINESTLVITHSAGVAVMWTIDAGRESTLWLSGTVEDVGYTLHVGCETIHGALKDMHTNAAEDLTSWASTAGSTVVTTYDTASGWVTGGVSTLEDLTGDLANGAEEVADDMVEAVSCNAFWCF